jgi:hypothetical protein
MFYRNSFSGSSVLQGPDEIGICIALGATGSGVQWMVMRESRVLLAAGLVLGIPIAWRRPA